MTGKTNRIEHAQSIFTPPRQEPVTQ